MIKLIIDAAKDKIFLMIINNNINYNITHEKTKLNYVSCSPYRVPVARLAAAQAYLKKKI